MTEDITAQTINLKDGRTLAFAEYGAKDGVPILYFTGTNSSRLEGAWFDAAAATHNVRLIAIDRPGYGLSDFQPGRTLLDWSDDIGQLTVSLGISKFGILALSGGGPHAAAVAYKMPDHLSAVAIVSGVCPYDSPMFHDGMWPPGRLIYFIARRLPFAWNARIQAVMNDPDNVIKNKDRLASPDTALLMNRPEVGNLFRLSQIESMRNGTQGAAQEAQLLTRPWGFELSAITIPIMLWYGEDDLNIPIAQGRYMNENLPNSTLNVIPNEAHFSLINNHIDKILAGLMQ